MESGACFRCFELSRRGTLNRITCFFKSQSRANLSLPLLQDLVFLSHLHLGGQRRHVTTSMPINVQLVEEECDILQLTPQILSGKQVGFSWLRPTILCPIFVSSRQGCVGGNVEDGFQITTLSSTAPTFFLAEEHGTISLLLDYLGRIILAS